MRALLSLSLIAALACAPADSGSGDGAPQGDDAAADTGAGGAGGAAGGEVAGGGGGPVADTSLGGVRWMLAAVRGTPARAAEPDRAPYIEFAPGEGRASGNASCNRFSGPYQLSGDSLSFGPMISTKMACLDSALTAQETAFLGALAEVRSWRMAGDTLVMGGAAGDLVRFNAAS